MREAALALALALAAAGAARAAEPEPPRRLAFRHLHTEETLEVVYRENGGYVPAALAQVNHLLRDFRTGEEHRIDPRVLDILYELQKATGSKSPFQIVSAYRSPHTNQMLTNRSTEVARRSQHMEGTAIDIALEDVAAYKLHDAARALNRGGVGYYPYSRFIHVDVGPVREWKGT